MSKKNKTDQQDPDDQKISTADVLAGADDTQLDPEDQKKKSVKEEADTSPGHVFSGQ